MPAVELGAASGKYICRYRGADVPVTHLFHGEREVDRLADAIAFVAGPLPDGSWLGGAVIEFELMAVN